MKTNRHGQAKILSDAEVKLIANALREPFKTMFWVGIYTGARINEICHLKKSDVFFENAVREKITFRKKFVKGKTKTRQVPVHEKLKEILEKMPKNESDWVFPALRDLKKPMHPDTFDHELRKICQSLGIQGVSSHSMRRTFLTNLHLQNVPLRVIQKLSGHARLDHLATYLEVPDEALVHAVVHAVHRVG